MCTRSEWASGMLEGARRWKSASAVHTAAVVPSDRSHATSGSMPKRIPVIQWLYLREYSYLVTAHKKKRSSRLILGVQRSEVANGDDHFVQRRFGSPEGEHLRWIAGGARRRGCGPHTVAKQVVAHMSILLCGKFASERVLHVTPDYIEKIKMQVIR